MMPSGDLKTWTRENTELRAIAGAQALETLGSDTMKQNRSGVQMSSALLGLRPMYIYSPVQCEATTPNMV